MKIGTYKEGKYIVTYYEDGTIWECMQNPLYPILNWDDLPEGYKFPEPEYNRIITDSRLEIIDFGTTPPTILTLEEWSKDYKFEMLNEDDNRSDNRDGT